jgi:putative DNA-invertase from lambdoid prophage Rac
MTVVQNMIGQNAGISEIAKVSGLSRQTIYRIKDDPAAADALAVWNKAAA